MTAPAPTALSRPLLSAGLHRRAHRRPGATARVRQLLLRWAQHHRIGVHLPMVGAPRSY